ncbi:MAG: hypothetical protein RBR64_03675 [Bacteroidales bacterium]|jgi:hypothetical protein|nr:hypothetical protein [Bacteroidales bacterium]
MRIDEIELGICPLCGRKMIEGNSLNEHHLIPKKYKGEKKVFMHKICHQKIHSVFTEKELFEYFYTFDRLKEHKEMDKFIKWVRKKPVDYVGRNYTSNILKLKRKMHK